MECVPSAGCLLNHGQDLGGLHVEHLGDPALHDEEVGIVHVQLNWPEQVAHPAVLDVAPIDQIFVFASDHHLETVQVLNAPKCTDITPSYE